MGTFNTASTSLSVVGSIRESFTLDKLKTFNVAVGSYTVPTGKTFYLVYFMSDGTGSHAFRCTPPGGSITDVWSGSGAGTMQATCDVPPVSGSIAAFGQTSTWLQPNTAPANTVASVYMGISLSGLITVGNPGIFRVPGPYIHVFPAGSVLTFSGTTTRMIIQGYEI